MGKPSLRWACVFIPTALFLFVACRGTSHQSEVPQARQGVLDLRMWNFSSSGPVRLSGEYEFYWRQLLTPEEFAGSNRPERSGFIDVPRAWNGFQVDGQPISGKGYATYRLTILFDETPPPLAFKFLDMGTAYSVFVNGKKMLAVGSVATAAGHAIPAYSPQVMNFVADANRIELIYHVSNFHHNRGGAWEVVQLGLQEDIYAARERRLTFDFFLFGALMIISIYHVVLFILRPKEISTLYFAVFCFLIGCRILATMERYLVFLMPGIPWELLVKFEYLVTNLSTAFFALFMYSLFRQQFLPEILKAILFVCAVVSSIVILFPARVSTVVVQPYQAFVLAAFFYGLFVLIKSVRSRQDGAAVFLAGYGMMFLAAINDVLDANAIIHSGHFIGLGLFIFIFSQAILLAVRFSKAFLTVDSQRQALAKANADYSRELHERIRAEQSKKELEEKLVRSQKMEALGLLAGEVAHDLNNVLSGIVSYPDLLLMELPKNSALSEPIQSIRDAGMRAASIVQDLLTMARRSVTDLQVLNLNQVISDYLNSPEYEKLMKDYRHIPVVSDLEPDLLNIKGSEVHLKKTVMNLVTNAAEAQPEGGIITIHTHNRYVDRPINGYETVMEGDYAVLSVEDKGIGIAQEDLMKIFEPFYTRKRMGRSGTGLGMAIAWGTVQDHHGYIDVQSIEGKGTVFDLYFPIVREEIGASGGAPNLEEFKGNGEVVMIVDDIKDQRQIASLMLKRLGYRVITSASGEEAVEYLKNHAVDILLLDMIMEPGIDGLETYQRIIRLHPGMKAVIASGYAETDRVRRALELGVGHYVKKPYTMQKIGSAIKAELQK
jgi:signal transduction histidine kinase